MSDALFFAILFVNAGGQKLRRLFNCAHVALCAILLVGCATIHNEPINQPITSQIDEPIGSVSYSISSNDDLFVGLSLSGGGTRAAAFSYGALSEFKRINVRSGNRVTSLFDRIDFLSGVSGGAVTAAYIGLKKDAGLIDFRDRFLLSDAEEAISTNVTPNNIVRAYSGGMNDSQFAQWLNINLFEGATLGDLQKSGRPRVWINASDIYYRTPFVFDSAAFDAICSDLNSYPIASAVAASAAVPVVFAPVVLRTFPNQCRKELPSWIVRAEGNSAAPPILKEFANAVTHYRNGDAPYIKLLDGGLVDNYGLSGFTIARLSAESPYGPLTAQQAVRMRRFLFLVIDGGLGPSGDWTHKLEGPSGPDLLMAASDTAIDSSVRSSFTAFDRTMSEWRENLVRWRCSLTVSDRRRYGLNKEWSCSDLKFFVGRINFDELGTQRASVLNSVPTRFKLPAETVDMLIEAGHQALHTNPTFKQFLSSL